MAELENKDDKIRVRLAENRLQKQVQERFREYM